MKWNQGVEAVEFANEEGWITQMFPILTDKGDVVGYIPFAEIAPDRRSGQDWQPAAEKILREVVKSHNLKIRGKARSRKGKLCVESQELGDLAGNQ